MQISYHSALTKIQKLQNYKKKKKICIGWYCLKLAGMVDTWLVRSVFKPVRNVGILISIYVPLRYILADTASTSTVSTTLILARFGMNI